MWTFWREGLIIISTFVKFLNLSINAFQEVCFFNMKQFGFIGEKSTPHLNSYSYIDLW